MNLGHLVMWKNLDSVKVKQVRKRKTNINAYMWNLEKMVLVNLFVGEN